MSLNGTKKNANMGPPAAIAFMLFFMMVLFLTPTAGYAAELSGTSRTYAIASETSDGSNLLPAYEYLDFAVQNLGTDTVSVHFGGWLGYDLRDDSFGFDKNKGSDLQYGFVSWRRKTNNTIVNIGRVMIFDGGTAERVDGIYAKTDLPYGFGISAFGGAPVETNINLPGNNVIYGGRISHQVAGIYTIGASYLREDKNSDVFRKEGAVDLWLHIMNKVEVSGRSAYNFDTTGWMENSYYLMLGPFYKLRLNVEASWYNYADYFAATTNNAFSFAPGGPLDPNEKLNVLGPELFYAINEKWGVSADYKKYDYDIAGNASYYGAKVAYMNPKLYNAGLSYHKMDGDVDRLQYDEYRAYMSKKFSKTDIAIDLLDVKYKVAINGVDNVYSAALAAGYEFTEKLKAGADVEYSKNPDFDKEVRLFLKLIYQFDAELGKHKGV